MKKLLLFASLFAFTLSSQAQVRELMLQKAKQVANSKSQQKQESSQTSQQQTESNSADTTAAGNDSTPANTAPNFGFSQGSKKDVNAEYSFSDNIYYEIQAYKKDGSKDEKPMYARYLFAEKYLGSVMITEDNKSTDRTEVSSVLEFEKNQMVMMTSTKDGKSGFVIKYDAKKIQETAEEDTTTTQFTKTGRTKSILGYTCEEWVTTDEDGTRTELWVSKQVALDIAKVFTAFDKNNKKSNSKKGETSDYPQGTFLEMIFIEKKGEKTVWTAKEINLNKQVSIKTGDYTFMGF